jgi:hypothetical protein
MRRRPPSVTLFVTLLVGVAAGIALAFLPRPWAGADRLEFTASGDFSASSYAADVLADIDAVAPEFHLALGDLSYGTTGEEARWCDFVAEHLGEDFPFQLLAGNHEANGQSGNINDFAACLPNQLPGLVGTYGRQWYVDVPRDDPLVRLVALSPALPFPGGSLRYEVGSVGYEWTAAAIDEARAAGIPWVVVGMHKPCLSVGQYDCETTTDLLDLLVDRKVDLVLHGHEHSYMRTHQLADGPLCPRLEPGAYDEGCVADTGSAFRKGAGTVFVTIGTGGVGLRDIEPRDDAEAGYFATASGANVNPTWGSLHVVATAQDLTAEFRRASGGTFTDAFRITTP